jgi:hypothetical protein
MEFRQLNYWFVLFVNLSTCCVFGAEKISDECFGRAIRYHFLKKGETFAISYGKKKNTVIYKSEDWTKEQIICLANEALGEDFNDCEDKKFDFSKDDFKQGETSSYTHGGFCSEYDSVGVKGLCITMKNREITHIYPYS